MATERLIVDNIITLTSLVGSVTDIDDDPDGPDDGNWIYSDGSGSSIFTGEFETPSRALEDGAGLQEFRVKLRKSLGDTGNIGGDPSGGNAVDFTIELVENGTSITTLVTDSFTGAGGLQTTVFNGTFNASSITNPSLVQVTVTQTNGSSGNPNNRRYLDVGAVEWNAVTLDPRYIIIS